MKVFRNQLHSFDQVLDVDAKNVTLQNKSQHFLRKPDNTPALAINKLSNITVFPLAKKNTLYQ